MGEAVLFLRNELFSFVYNILRFPFIKQCFGYPKAMLYGC
ncbi:hypothetical protein HMPREF2534_02803 [Bacteroides thetaiotaomicron]|nr:hypothetical protein HMPREF2534_02803 [Bacteroides thetaiotaomicron]